MVASRTKSGSKRKDSTTEDRKLDHIRICLEHDVQSSVSTGFNEIQLIHNAAPEMDLNDVDLQCTFLGHKLSAPIIVTAITGGHNEATQINQNIAKAVEDLGLAMGVGSQRAAIEDSSLSPSFTIARQSAPTAFLIGNIGAPQLSQGYGVDEAKTAIAMIKANALAIHFNAAQEAIQPEGESTFSGITKALENLAKNISVPIIAKETGAGISRETAIMLAKTGVKALDVAGLGGTSWPAVEAERAKAENSQKATLGRWFSDWGIPTAISTFEAAQNINIPIIASGGIRTGIDIAKAIALGAQMGGVALPVLAPSTTSSNKVREYLETLMHGLKATMFLIGASNLKELSRAPIVIQGATRNWLELRDFDLTQLAKRRIRL